MRQIRDVEKNTSLLFVELRRLLVKMDNLVGDLPDWRFQILGRFTLRFFCADLFAQPVPLSLQLLQFSFGFSPFGIDLEQFVNPRLVTAAARSEPLANKIRFLTNHTNVEHGRSVDATQRVTIIRMRG